MKKQDITVIGAALFAVFYLINPTAGFIELIPDNIPLIGRADGVYLVVVETELERLVKKMVIE